MAVWGGDQYDVGFESAADTQEVTQHYINVLRHAVSAAVVLHYRSPHSVHLHSYHVTASAAQVNSDAADACSCVYDNAGGAGGGVVRADFLGGHHEIASYVAEYTRGGRVGAGGGG